MVIHYIILAHKNPQQVNRLVNRLRSNDSFFYIHIDKNVSLEDYKNLLKESADIYLLPDDKRIYMQWGDISMITSVLDIFRKILSAQRPGYCILMSGQDYPLKNNDYINQFLTKNSGKDFINHFPLPSDKWPNKGIDRMNRYKISFSDKRGDFKLFPSIHEPDFFTRENLKAIKELFKRTKNPLLLKLFLKKRHFPKYINAHGGSQWWALTTETATKILEYISDHPDFLTYNNYTLLPDEIFFNSIVVNIHKQSPGHIAETFTYANWERKNEPLPVTFTLNDFDELKSLPDEVLFARKFDVEKDESILNKIDSDLLFV